MYVCWARRNRSALSCVCPSTNRARRRPPGSKTALPYQPATRIWRSRQCWRPGLAGIEEGLELPPGRPRTTSTRCPRTSGLRRGLPLRPEDLHDAILQAERSKVLRDALGEHVHEFLIRNKRAEWDSFKSYVSPYELERYLPVL